jgi:hypothetical protein
MDSGLRQNDKLVLDSCLTTNNTAFNTGQPNILIIPVKTGVHPFQYRKDWTSFKRFFSYYKDWIYYVILKKIYSCFQILPPSGKTNRSSPASLASKVFFNDAIGTRIWCMLSRSRIVAMLSSSDWKSMVTQ